jgi:DNA-binding transcriptional LysR family regulator
MFISDETLRVIHLVARHQSITTAAEQLNKVPSAISYTIKKTEEALAQNCFFAKDATSNSRQRAAILLNTAKRSSAIWKHFRRNTVLIHDGIERELTIAVNNIIPTAVLVEFIRDFEQQFSSTTLTLNLEVYNGCWDALYGRRADLVIGAPHAVPGSEGIISAL